MAFRSWQASQVLWGRGAGRQKRGSSCWACPLSRGYWSPSSRDSFLQWENVTCLVIFYSSTSDICKSRWVSGGFNLLFHSCFLLLELNFYDRHSVELLLAKMGQAEWASPGCTVRRVHHRGLLQLADEPHVQELIFRPAKDGPPSPEKPRRLCWAEKTPPEDGGAVRGAVSLCGASDGSGNLHKTK